MFDQLDEVLQRYVRLGRWGKSKVFVYLNISKVFGTGSDNILMKKLMKSWLDNGMNRILVEQIVPEGGDQ